MDRTDGGAVESFGCNVSLFVFLIYETFFWDVAFVGISLG